MMDIDHFKAVNDTYGHGVGDEILKEFALRVQDKLRGFDLVARMGGEEFAAILPDVSEETAYIVAERLRRSISNHPFKCAVPEGQISVMVSIGGTIIQPGTQQALDVVLKQADDALYAAKGNGRDQCFFDGVGKLNPEDHLPTPRQFIKD